MPFIKGQSGNPVGRPKGSSKKQELWNLTVVPFKLPIAEKLVSEALAGNEKYLLFLAERLFPRVNDLQVNFSLPDNLTENDLFALSEQIIRLTGEGDITPEQAQLLTNTIKTHRDSLVIKNLMEQVKGLSDKIEKLEK